MRTLLAALSMLTAFPVGKNFVPTEDEIRRELEEPLSYYAQRDRGIIADRVCKTILTRQKEALRFE